MKLGHESMHFRTKLKPVKTKSSMGVFSSVGFRLCCLLVLTWDVFLVRCTRPHSTVVSTSTRADMPRVRPAECPSHARFGLPACERAIATISTCSAFVDQLRPLR